MTRSLASIAVSVALVAGLAVSGDAETVISQSKVTGGSTQTAAFYDWNTSSWATVFPAQLADGSPAYAVYWGSNGPAGYVSAFGIAPVSAVKVSANGVRLNLDLASLLQVGMTSGSPAPCVGTLAPVANDHVNAFMSIVSNGTQDRVTFYPFYWMPGGLQYEVKVAGHSTDANARFAGTCAGMTVSGTGFQSASIVTHNGNITQVLTLFP